MRMLCVGLGLLVWVAVINAGAQPVMPELRYDPPPNFYHSAIRPPDDYTSNQFDASLQVYPFRTFSGNMEQIFPRTLLQDWLDPRFREPSVATQPVFGRVAIPSAQAVLTAQFAASTGRQHLRMVIVVGNAAAIVDASASSPDTWHRAGPLLNAFSATLRVEAGAPAPDMGAGPGPRGAAVAGLYMGTKSKYMPDLNRPVGFGRHVMALHYYLFSANGRVYRAYDMLDVPGGDPARFDFDAAERADPGNSGRYVFQDGQMIIRIGGQEPQTLTVTAPAGGRVTIETIVYIRQ